jgi:hypothetical protein
MKRQHTTRDRASLLRTFKFCLVLTLLALAGSCEEYLGSSVDCTQCTYDKPDSADLVLHLTINSEHPAVPIIVYRGDVEDRQVDWVDTARESPYYLYSAVNQFYSVRAEYKVGDRTIVAIDGDKIKAKHVSDACDYACWIVTGGVLEAELKFE